MWEDKYQRLTIWECSMTLIWLNKVKVTSSMYCSYLLASGVLAFLWHWWCDLDLGQWLQIISSFQMPWSSARFIPLSRADYKHQWIALHELYYFKIIINLWSKNIIGPLEVTLYETNLSFPCLFFFDSLKRLSGCQTL